MKRALVTGASGFVGGHLVPYLHEKGLEIWASYYRRLAPFPFRVHWQRADLTQAEQALHLVRVSRPEVVFHLAAQAVQSESWRDPVGTLDLNVAGTIFLLEGILRYAPKARVVLVSSGQVYGTTFFREERVTEEALRNPVTPYAGSKLLMELAALNFLRRNGPSVVVARAFNQIGPGQKPSGVFSDFCRQVALMEAKKRPPTLRAGNLRVVRDFIHIRDAVRAYDLLARRGKSGEVYNVGSGKGIRLTEVLDFLAQESRIPFRVQALPSRFRAQDFARAVADPTKLRRLGWRPRESIWEALRALLNEWRKKVRRKG